MSQEERHVKTGRRPTIASSIDPPLSQRFAHSFEPSREMSQPETAAPLPSQINDRTTTATYGSGDHLEIRIAAGGRIAA